MHKLLKAGSEGFGCNKRHPLLIDLLVIDEMSMVDLSLMQALLNALPKNSQLILVGDPNQLPPVGSGAIWHQLLKEEKIIHFGKAAIHLKKHYRSRGEIASLSKILCEQGISSFKQHILTLPKSANFQVNNFATKFDYNIQHNDFAESEHIKNETTFIIDDRSRLANSLSRIPVE